MKSLVISGGIIVFFIFFILNIDRVDFTYPELLAEEENTYFMLTVDKYEQDPVYNTILKGNEKLHSVRNIASAMNSFKDLKRTGATPFTTVDLEQAQEMFPELEIEDAPAVLIFNNKGLVFKSYELQEAREFLRTLK